MPFQDVARMFGRLVALRLAERQLTPTQLAQQVPSVNRFTIRRIIHADPPHDPHLSSMAAIADALETQLHRLLGSQDDQGSVSLLSARAVEIVTLVARFPPVWQEAIVTGLRSLARGLDTPTDVPRADEETDTV